MIVEGMIAEGLSPLPDSPAGEVYLPEMMLTRGGGDCEDWVLFLLIMMDAAGIDHEGFVGLGYYRDSGPGATHAIAVFPRLGVMVDVLYWWIHPLEIAEEFVLTHVLTIRETLALFPVRGTATDLDNARSRGWLE
jgi:hypothetical protein